MMTLDDFIKTLHQVVYHAYEKNQISLIPQYLNINKESLESIQAALKYIPVAVGMMYLDFKIYYANQHLERISNKVSILGAHIRDVVDDETSQLLMDNIKNNLDATEHPDGYFVCQNKKFEIILMPQSDKQGKVKAVIFFLKDKGTNEYYLQIKKVLVDYIFALNAHAIVAETDHRGIIHTVNEKFCRISQYSRDELIGQTHRVINSGYHDQSFFQNLWQTISRGIVWQGEICNRAKDGSLYWVYTTIVPFINEDGKPFKYISIRADITQLKNTEQEAQWLAMYDPLTSLANRRLLLQQLDQIRISSEKEQSWCALFYLDVDYFKNVNDIYGHNVGDHFLQTLALRLSNSIQKKDLVSRISGDEFVIIATGFGNHLVTATHNIERLGDRLLETLNQPYYLSHRSGYYELNITLSIGATPFYGTNIVSEDILQRADLALYRAKSEGRNKIVYFDEQYQIEAKHKIALENELRNAIEKQQLNIYYQPILNARRKVIGLEALLRWQHSEYGSVSPAEFIPIAEQSNLIHLLGRWVISEVIQQLALWKEIPEYRQWTISINISAHQLKDPQFVHYIADLMRQYQLSPSQICLELTETAIMTNMEMASKKLTELAKLGFIISLDDFGTGYSSLSRLQELPIKQLKIDKSFVHSIHNNEVNHGIISAILSLASTFNIHVIAEGVETEQQFNYLKQAGCRAFQGFLFSQAIPVDKIAVCCQLI